MSQTFQPANSPGTPSSRPNKKQKKGEEEFEGTECIIEGVKHRYVEEVDNETPVKAWNLTFAMKHYMSEKAGAKGNRVRMLTWLEGNEDIHVMKVGTQYFLKWPEYIDCLARYLKTNLAAVVRRGIARTLRKHVTEAEVVPVTHPFEAHKTTGITHDHELYQRAKNGPNGVFHRRKEQYVFVKVPKLTSKRKNSSVLTRSRWYFNYVLVYYCKLFGDDFGQMLQEYFKHTIEGKLKLVDIMRVIKQQKVEQLRVRKAQPKPATPRGAGPVIAGQPQSHPQPHPLQPLQPQSPPPHSPAHSPLQPQRQADDMEVEAAAEAEERTESSEDGDIAPEDRSTRSLSTQLARIVENAAVVVPGGEKKKVNKNCVSVPAELSKILAWPNVAYDGEAVTFLRALHMANLTSLAYERFWHELKRPSFLPGNEKITRWHACKRRYLVEVKGIKVHVDVEHDRTYMAEFVGLFRLFVQTIKQAGGTFSIDSRGRKVLMIRSAWDKRAKVAWGTCAYHVVPLHDKLRSQHWEDVVPLLTWNGDDDNIEEAKIVGKEVIELNKLISKGEMVFEFGGDTFAVEQVCTPDLKALFGGIVRELGDFDYNELNFYYFAKHIDSVRQTKKPEEIAVDEEMRKATAAGLVTPWVAPEASVSEKIDTLKAKYPAIVDEFKLQDQDVATFVPKPTRLICPLCNCSSHLISDSIRDPHGKYWKIRRQFEHVWGVKCDDFGLCEFHALERLTEALICRTAKDDARARQFLINFFYHLNKTKLKAHARALNVEVDLVDKMDPTKEIQIAGLKLVMCTKAELENPEYEKASFGMITYGACSLIRRTYKVWVRLLNKEMQKHGADELVAWEKFDLFWATIEGTTEQVAAWKSADPEFTAQVQILQDYALQYERCYGPATGWYLHILVCHAPLLWTKYGSLLRISNQSFEACNHHHRVLGEHVGCNGGFGRSIAEDVTEHRLIAYLLRLKDEENPFNDYIVTDYSGWLQRTNRSTRNRNRANAENVPGDESPGEEDDENAEPPSITNNTTSTNEMEEDLIENVAATFQFQFGDDELEEVQEDDDLGSGVSFSTHFASTNNNNNNNNNNNSNCTGPRLSFQLEVDDSPVFHATESPSVESTAMPSPATSTSHRTSPAVFASPFTPTQSRVVTGLVAPFQSPLFNSASQHNIEKVNPTHVNHLPTNPFAFYNPLLTQSLPYGYAMNPQQQHPAFNSPARPMNPYAGTNKEQYSLRWNQTQASTQHKSHPRPLSVNGRSNNQFTFVTHTDKMAKK